MSKVKINKKLQKSSVFKVVGLVFMVVTLLTALALTNNTVRQFITDSFADGGRVRPGVCEDLGSGRARCRAEKEWDRISAQAKEYNRLYYCINDPDSCGDAKLKGITSRTDRWNWLRLNYENYICDNHFSSCPR